MIKNIIFDLDGVLIESKKAHFNAFNAALQEIDGKYVITEEEHLHYYDGLPTKKKLAILTQRKGLPVESYDRIWNRKQELTSQYIQESVNQDEDLVNLFKDLKKQNITLCVATNSIRSTTFGILSRLGILHLLDLVVTNEDVNHPKPYPEIYWKCMMFRGFAPKECLVIEDAPQGLLAASQSGANVLRVKNRQDLTFEKIMNEMAKNGNQIIKPKWNDPNLNIVIPMAGLGSRFEKANYSFPKPILPIKNLNDKTMIQMVVDNLNINGQYIFIIRKEHAEQYKLPLLLNTIAPGCVIIKIDRVTEGAACTVLLAKEYINNNNPLFITNCDQFMVWDSTEFMYSMSPEHIDGGIITFFNNHPKWSYVKLREDGFIGEVREKEVISTEANTGAFFWKRGSDYVKYSEMMISKNLRVNQEFFVAPCFNEAISDGKKIKMFHIDKFFGTGTPEDLEYFVANYKP